jgi:DHA1 family bicyclomycin/chloramphenicol resistance-like MFS transporter
VHGAIEPFPDIAGVASAANGAIRMLGGAVAGGVVTALYDGTAFAMTTSMLLFAAAGGVLWLWLLRPRVVVLGAAAD